MGQKVKSIQNFQEKVSKKNLREKKYANNKNIEKVYKTVIFIQIIS